MGKIGLFDAGIGGLVLMRAIVTRLPTHDYVFFGDSGHGAYGNRTPDEIYQLTEKGIQFLFSHDCDIVFVLCNTADSNALTQLQQNNPQKPIIGIVRPAIEAAIRQSKNQRIGVMGTEAVIRSGTFSHEALALKPALQLYTQACPMLVSLIESYQSNSDTMHTILKTYLAPLKQAGIDTLLLGCMHYSLIRTQIQAVIGGSVWLVDESSVAAESLTDFLARHPELEHGLSKNIQRQFFCSAGGKKSFELVGSEFYGVPIKATEVMV